MNDALKYRMARPLERFEPYAFLLGWLGSWILPYDGFSSWVVLFAPDLLLLPLWRWAWKRSPPRVAVVRTAGAGFALDAGGASERIEHANVEALTAVHDKTGAVTELRLDRAGARALVFEVQGTTPERIARAIGIDPTRSRQRHALLSRIVPRGITLVMLGLGVVVWARFGGQTVSEETAGYILLYQRAVLMPLVVLYAVPTVFDVGRDGIAWQWLFWKDYLPFRNVASVTSKPSGAPPEKVTTFEVTMSDGSVKRFFRGKAIGAFAQVMEAFEKSRSEVAPTTIDERLARSTNEPTSAWIDRLRAIGATGASEGSYRGVSMAHVWAVAEDLHAPATARCGAALVLGVNDASRTRLQTLGTQIVDPDLRAVLEAVARDAPASELAQLVERVTPA